MFSLSSIEPNLVNERKFVGPGRSLSFVLALLDSRCLPDARFPVGHINSIYFDTVDSRAYWEKANGDNLKMKVRLRWYGNSDEVHGDIPAFLELKYRLGSARRKVRLDVTVPSSWICRTPLASPSLVDFLAAHEEELGEPVSVCWRPTACISYDRVRYDDPLGGSRVSVDWNIRVDRFNETLYPWASPFSLADDVVCEFKNKGGRPPAWAEEMAGAGFRLRSFSKYGKCMARLMDGAPYHG